MTWLVPRSELTPDQLRAVELDSSEHRVVVGAPGTGKTQILLHRARYLIDFCATPPPRFHIFVFTNVLTEYLRSALHYLELPSACVSTFDAWCREYHRQYIRGSLPWDADNRMPDFPQIRSAVRDHVLRNDIAEPYDFVMVDEGQDLDPIAFDILRRIGRHVTVCLDHKQQIYDQGSSEADILGRLDVRRRSVNFLDAFRCCPFVVELAASFIADESERAQHRRQARTQQSERERPLLYCAADFEDERRRLFEVVRTRIQLGERIAVLFPTGRTLFGFAKGMREAGLDVEVPIDGRRRTDGTPLDFESPRPKLLTYHRAKGLTFDSVLMPRIAASAFGKAGEDRALLDRLLLVGISRATRWVYLSTHRSLDIVGADRIAALEEAGTIVVQRGPLPLFSPVTPESNKPPTDPLDVLG